MKVNGGKSWKSTKTAATTELANQANEMVDVLRCANSMHSQHSIGLSDVETDLWVIQVAILNIYIICFNFTQH